MKGLLKKITNCVFLLSFGLSCLEFPRLGIKESEMQIYKNYGSLVLSKMKVYDNGEGDEWPHGPYGSLYALIYDCKEKDCECSKNIKKDYKKIIWYRSRLEGPNKINHSSRIFGEWLDGDEKNFDNQEIFKWRSENDKILLVVYESDPGLLRDHDMLFCEKIQRKDTEHNKIYESKIHCKGDVIKKLKILNETPAVYLELNTKQTPGFSDYIK